MPYQSTQKSNFETVVNPNKIEVGDFIRAREWLGRFYEVLKVTDTKIILEYNGGPIERNKHLSFAGPWERLITQLQYDPKQQGDREDDI